MSQKITPALKGLITGLLMIAFVLYLDKTNQQNPKLQYIAYGIYGAGIIWTLMSYLKLNNQPRFSELFTQGFKCFIVVTIVMVAFTFIFLKTNPQYMEKEMAYQREELIKQKDKSPEQIDEMINNGKKGYVLRYVSASVFGYLIIGAMLTAASSGIIILRRNA